MRLAMIAVAAASLSLGACQSFSLADYAEAANELDPDCYKDVTVTVRPMFLFGWVVPVVSGDYRKVCNPGQASAATAGPRTPLTPGTIIGGPVGR